MHHSTQTGTFSSRQEDGIRGSEYGGYVDYEFDETKEVDSTSQPSSLTELGCSSRLESTTSRKEPSTISALVSKPGSKDGAPVRSKRPPWNVASKTEGATAERYYFADTGFDCSEHSETPRGLKAGGDHPEFSFRFRYALLLISCALIIAAVAVLMVRRTAASYYEAVADAPEDALAPMTAQSQEHSLRDQVMPTQVLGVRESFTADDLSASVEDEPSVSPGSLPTSTTGGVKAQKLRDVRSHAEGSRLMDPVEQEDVTPEIVSSWKPTAWKWK
ncbi:hypothetical protein HPB51_013779 [Rhipicephalus microplus]|uniref:Uncharacterized protein n=1 Tax=Rhipicephalus microplus TaxID=6941 RepID=A0A9J6F3P6_RHIMP|nr:hypothetical protein HPB51_013779 [Rhipicephalus microplus]